MSAGHLKDGSTDGELLDRLVERLLRKLDALGLAMQNADVAEFVALYRRPRRLIVFNFVAGLARGVGIAVGFLLLGALVVYLLRAAVSQALVLNLPVIGHFLAALIRIIQAELRTTHGP